MTGSATLLAAFPTVSGQDVRVSIDELLPDRLQATFWPAARVPGDGHLALWGTTDLVADVRALGLPLGRPATLPTVLPRSPRARTRVTPGDVPALVVPVLSSARALTALPPAAVWPAWCRPSDALLAWSAAS